GTRAHHPVESVPTIPWNTQFQQFDEAGRMKPSSYYDRVVDVMEELVKFTLLTRDVSTYLTDRYSERKESAEALMERVNLSAAT
ncbi:hypothetical protein ACFONL_07675, partial [Camelimonas fluminis]